MTEAWGQRGKHSRTAKLDETTVRAIKLRLRDGVIYRDIADEFGISISTVHRIKTGASWANVKVDQK